MQSPRDDAPLDERPSHTAHQLPDRVYIEAPAYNQPPPEFQDEASVPFLKLRGRWLREMGFNVGSQLKIEADKGVITITVLGNPVLPRPGVPRLVQRVIHHTMVEAENRPICPNGGLGL